MVIIETSEFTRTINSLLTDEEYRELQEALVTKPDLGVILRNSGGIRKLRWRLHGRGKSGGIRIVYYWKISDEQIYMLFCFPKNKQDNLTAEQLAQLKAIVERW